MNIDRQRETRENNRRRARALAMAGWGVMLLLSLTQLAPGLRWAGFSVFAGIGCFFALEAICKTPAAQSGLRFRGLAADLKKPGVLFWLPAPVVTAIAAPFLGDFLFQKAYTAHVIDRAGAMLDYERLPLLILQVVILAWGEKIAWRGFFLGKGMERFPFWPWAILSSALFAMGHISPGAAGLVLFDIGFVFIDSLLFSILFRRSGNCLVSTIAHIAGNAAGIALCFALV